MTFAIVIHYKAQVDIDNIFLWYEEQRTGLGNDFINSIDDIIIKINRNPYYAFCIEQDARNASLKMFPYMLYTHK